MHGLPEAAAALLGAAVRDATPLTGGDLSAVFAVRFADGRRAIVKGGPNPPGEAAMLAAISASGAPAPAVLAADARVLVLEPLAAGGGLQAAWAELGAIVARLHRSNGPDYGWHEDAAFGAVAIHNARCDHWPTFWAERRLLPQCRHVPAGLARRIERLADSLDRRLPAQPVAALLHGDLWSGNVLADGGRISGLIDPACYHGDAEVDLAMLELFASPDAAFYEAYGPAAPGAAERRPIYRLWPALVHLRLFGSRYRGLVERCLDEAGVRA